MQEIEWLEPELPSLSMCAECRHRRDGAVCAAYPNGIPDRWLFTVDVHDQVESDQVGRTTFHPSYTAKKT
jgi:hypothetical protein